MEPENDNPIVKQNISQGYERQIAYLDNIMVVICDFTDGPMNKPDPPHSHPHEQITYVAEGELLFIKGEKKLNLKKGDMVTVPSGIPHCIQTKTGHVKLIDSFYPLRKDFLK